MKIIYGTTNINKIKEMQELFKNYEVELISLKDIDFDEDIKEDGDTFLENSLIKAKAIHNFCKTKKINLPILTDDAGLCVASLDNRPGVLSARYAGDHAPQITCLNKLLNELKDKKDRRATFYCALTFVYNDKYYQVLGSKQGMIATTIGKLGGLTYTPIFIPEGYNKPASELTNVMTHRHNALAKLIEKLKQDKVL